MAGDGTLKRRMDPREDAQQKNASLGAVTKSDAGLAPKRVDSAHSGRVAKVRPRATSPYDEISAAVPATSTHDDVGDDSLTDVASPSALPQRPRSEQPTEPQFVDPLVGRVLGSKYRVTRHLASGGMGSVYEAKHELLGHRVALKVLHTHLVQRGETARRFLNEAKVAANIDHPNVVRALDMDETPEGIPFFVLEYLDGQPLSAIVGRGRRLSARRSLQIAMQVLSALEVAHEQGIVHRDIKPENIFLLKRSGDQEHVKVLDFGIAKISAATAATSQGRIFGTPMYMSPEQLKDSSSVDARADIYAVGVLLYEMLGGTVPFVADGLAELMMLAATTEPTPLDELRIDLPEGLGDLIRQSFSANVDSRPLTAPAFRHELSLFLNVVTQMDLERIESAPDQETLDPETVRHVHRMRRHYLKRKVPTWKLVLSAVFLLGVGIGTGLVAAPLLHAPAESRANVDANQNVDANETVVAENPATSEAVLEGTPAANEQPAQPVAQEQERSSVEDVETALEPKTSQPAQAEGERTLRHSAKRRPRRVNRNKREPESGGLSFQQTP